LKGNKPADWRTSLYYHYYEFPGAHSVRRHEGVATDRYKLIRFYGHDTPNGEEWEFYDLKNDPKEMKSQFGNPEYAGKIAELKKEILNLREKYNVPDDVGGKPITKAAPRKPKKKKK
jgi:arylsulfatase A-like enzyme